MKTILNMLKLLPITRFASVRVLPEIGRLLRPLPNCNNHGYSVNSVQKYPKNLHTVSFSTGGEDYRGVMHSKETPCYSEETPDYQLIKINISKKADEEDIIRLFEGVRMEKPEIIKLENGKRSGRAILKLFPDDTKSLKLCLQKQGMVFKGFEINVNIIQEAQYGAYLGKTMIKVENFPFEWGYREIFFFLKQIDVAHKMNKIVLPFGSQSVSAGRAYLMFSRQKIKDEVSKLLSETEVIDTVNGGTKRLVVTNSSWMDATYEERKKKWKENAKLDYRGLLEDKINV